MAEIPGKFSREDLIRGATFLVFAGALVFCASRHTPWRDEFQSFLVATRVHSLGEFWTATRYERTPPLHYGILAVLWPGLRSILEPRAFISFVTIAFSLWTAFLLLFRLRLPYWIATLSIFGVFFFREWGVISRSYILGAAFLFAALDFKLRDRRGWGAIFLGLSALTHTLFLLGGAVLFAWELFTRLRLRSGISRKDLGLGFAAILFLIGLLHQVPPSDSDFGSALNWPGGTRFFGRWLQNLGVVFFPLERVSRGSFLTGEDWIWSQTPVRFGWGVLALGLLFSEFRRARGSLFRFFASTAPLFLIFVCVQGGSFRYYGVVCAFFIYAWAEAYRKGSIVPNWKSISLVAVPAVSTAVWLAVWNPVYPRFDFSDGPRVAERVGEKGTSLYSVQSFLGFSVMAMTGKPIYDLALEKWSEYPFFRRTAAVSDPLAALCGPRPSIEARAGDHLIAARDDLARVERIHKECESWKEVYRTTRRIVTDESFVVFEKVN
jgi:hypothetical protein